jgi:hypothetical protein
MARDPTSLYRELLFGPAELRGRVVVSARAAALPSTGAARAEWFLNGISIVIGRPTAIKHASGLGLAQDAAATCGGGGG